MVSGKRWPVSSSTHLRLLDHMGNICLIYQPLGMSFAEFQDLLPDKKFPKDLMQRSVQLTSMVLAFMHENNVVHTGESII